jgi:hypothetical protein
MFGHCNVSLGCQIDGRRIVIRAATPVIILLLSYNTIAKRAARIDPMHAALNSVHSGGRIEGACRPRKIGGRLGARGRQAGGGDGDDLRQAASDPGRR